MGGGDNAKETGEDNAKRPSSNNRHIAPRTKAVRQTMVTEKGRSRDRTERQTLIPTLAPRNAGTNNSHTSPKWPMQTPLMSASVREKFEGAGMSKPKCLYSEHRPRHNGRSRNHQKSEGQRHRPKDKRRSHQRRNRPKRKSGVMTG